MRYVITIAIFVALVAGSIVVLVTFRAEPYFAAAIGSLTAASVASVALVYNVISTTGALKKENSMRFVQVLPHLKSTFSRQIDAVICSTSSLAGNKTYNRIKKLGPEKYIREVISNQVIMSAVQAELRDSSNILLRAAWNEFASSFDAFQSRSRELDAEDFFKVIVANVGFDTFRALGDGSYELDSSDLKTDFI